MLHARNICRERETEKKRQEKAKLQNTMFILQTWRMQDTPQNMADKIKKNSPQ